MEQPYVVAYDLDKYGQVDRKERRGPFLIVLLWNTNNVSLVYILTNNKVCRSLFRVSLVASFKIQGELYEEIAVRADVWRHYLGDDESKGKYYDPNVFDSAVRYVEQELMPIYIEKVVGSI